LGGLFVCVWLMHFLDSIEFTEVYLVEQSPLNSFVVKGNPLGIKAPIVLRVHK
jgi:hypothetical protein